MPPAKKSTTTRKSSRKSPAKKRPAAKQRAKSDPKSAPQGRHFGRARNRAERVLQDPEASRKLADAADRKLDKKSRGKIKEVLSDVKALIRLIRAYANGEYRAISWESLVLAAAGVVYLVSPLDLIPDVLPGGLVDDAVVVAFVIGLIRDELDDFVAWEAGRA